VKLTAAVEGDAGAVAGDQPVVGDGDAMVLRWPSKEKSSTKDCFSGAWI
jgi:hypothetical protein